MLQSQSRHRNIAILTLQGFQKLQTAISQTASWNHYTKSCGLGALSEHTGISTHTLSKVHARQASVDLRTLVRYFSAFNLTLETSDYFSPIHVNETLDPVLVSSSNRETLSESAFSNHAVSWGMAPDVSLFYGRTADLDVLNHWILEQRCRLVTLIGIGGIGKTWLATKLAEQMQHKFQFVIWRSLRLLSGLQYSADSFSDLLDDLIRHLVPQPETNLPATTNLKMRLLMDCLHKNRCLLVLDNVESILPDCKLQYTPQAATESVDTGIDRFGCEEYGEMFRHLSQGRHQSCVVLTSRAEPKRIQQLSGDNLSTRVLPIEGLTGVEAQQIFKARGIFQGSPTEWSRAIAYYGGNPLILEMLAATIEHLFDGSLTAFLSQNTLIFDDIRELLDQQLDCLSPPEQVVMRVLADFDACLSFADLRSQISPSISTAVLLAALKSLKARSLIERTTAHFSLQPLLRDYVRNRFVSSPS